MSVSYSLVIRYLRRLSINYVTYVTYVDSRTRQPILCRCEQEHADQPGEMVKTTDQIPDLLRKMISDIDDHACHYWIYSDFFDILSPTNRQHTRWSLCPLHIDYDSLWNPEFKADGILFDVILKNQLPAEKERIKLAYNNIRAIKRINFAELPRSETDSNVYYQNQADGMVYQRPPTEQEQNDLEDVKNEA